MGAKPKPERKADVLKAMADYLLGSGISEATLRPAASAVGTSPRMLLYHFRSKEDLMVAALKEVRRRETEMLAKVVAKLPEKSIAEAMRAIWRWYASPKRLPYLQVFFEAWGVSLRRPYLFTGFLEAVRKDLLPLAEAALVARGYPPREATAIATFMIAAFRGLLIDLVANRDRQRLDDAMEIFILNTEVMAAKGPTAASAALGAIRAAAPLRRRPTGAGDRRGPRRP
jgi:AcrR family transcriptional regulator